jgi:hypothetical protein
MYSGRGNAAFPALGFPIRTSPAQRSVGNSPELFAATHVLHRLLAPRHPPHALSSLLTQISRPHAHLPAGLSKLETKVQAQGSSPYGPHCSDCCTSRVPHRFNSPWVSAARLEDARWTPLSWRTGLRELLLSAEIEFYPSYALVKERIQPSGWKLVELIGIEPTTSSLQS